MSDIAERPRFYEGQYLEAADLTAAVAYGREQLARTQLGAHRWGIALGLDLREVDGPNSTLDVFVQPGYAWDGFGRAILVAAPAKIAGSLFAAIDSEFVPGNPAPPARVVEVWIRYDETLTKGPRPGFETCDTAATALARVQETYRIEVGARATIASRRDPIVVAGRAIDAAQALVAFDPAAPELVDASVPFQTLPDGTEPAHWLVPLGVVMWEPGNPGRFVNRGAVEQQRHIRSRQYCGVVAASIEAANGHVRVHDRAQPYSASFSDELLWVEGDTRADGDVRIYGHRLEFVQSHAEAPVAPFQVLRADDGTTNTKKLQLVIGADAAGANRFAVGPQTAATPPTHAEHLVVTDDGKVGIGTSTPKAPLHVVADGLEIGTSATGADNFYVQSNTDGPRALRVYNGDIGAGTVVASFTATGRLGIGTNDPTTVVDAKGVLGIRQNALYLSGDDSWSSVTYNGHHNAANNGWVFPNPSNPSVTIEMDDGNGTPRFEVWSTVAGNNQDFARRLRINGHSGDVCMGAFGGRVGVGTESPAVALDVRGDANISGEVRFGATPLLPTGAPLATRVVWGNVSSAGGRVTGSGFTVARLGPGRYQITFTPGYPDVPTLIVTKVYASFEFDADAGVQPRENAIVDQLVAGSAIVATADQAGALVDSNFCFIAVGLR